MHAPLGGQAKVVGSNPTQGVKQRLIRMREFNFSKNKRSD
jgi:hypothetical protein